MLADALTCNAVVKSFGAEEREDARLARVVGKWRKRVRRDLDALHHEQHGAVARAAVPARVRGRRCAVVVVAGHATPGDVTYVLTSYFVIHGYLRDIGLHIRTTCSVR